MSGSLVHVILNIIFVSIPEEFLMITAMLLASYYFKIIDLKKEIIIKSILPTLVIAITSNVMRTIGSNDIVIMLTSTALFYILVLRTYYREFKSNEVPVCFVIRRKEYDVTFFKIARKMFVSLIIVLVSCAIFEFLVISTVVNITNLTLIAIQNSLILSIAVTLPERIIQLLIIYVLWRCVDFDVIKMNLKSFMKSVGFIILMILSFASIANATKLIIFDKILASLDKTSKLTMIFASVIFPILCIAFAYFRGRKLYAVAMLEYEIEKIKIITERLSDNKEIKSHLKQLDLYLKNNEHDKIYLVIDEITKLLSRGVE